MTAAELAKLHNLPVEEATPEELAAMKAGEEEIARGDFVTLEELKHELEAERRKARAKKAGAVSN
jgi:predicted transcriptional regulator